MKLICRTCHLEISKEVRELQDTSLLSHENGQDYIPKGFYIIDDNKMHLDLRDAIIINLKDLVNSKRHSNRSRLNGCCSMDGLDGRNRLCLRNHEIGTEKSDCWMSHFIALDSEMVCFE